MRPLRFIHAADLHLDSPFKGMSGLPGDKRDKLRNSTFEAFDRLINYAAQSRPDFLLIAGDLYDGEDRSIRAQHKFRSGMQKLLEAGVPVFISHGNHDHLSGRWTRFELPENVRQFGADVEQFTLETEGYLVRIAGFSYPKRHVTDRMIRQFPEAKDDSAIHIGMLHGSLDGDTSHAVYAPFSRQELLEKGYDYWALGHIHQRQTVNKNPHIVYPGNLQGRHRHESGSKGFYEVTVDGPETSLEFIPAGPVTFQSLIIDVGEARDMSSVLSICSEAVEHFCEEQGDCVLDLTLMGVPGFIRDEMAEEILDALRTETAETELFSWIGRLRLERSAEGKMLTGLGARISGTLDAWDEDDWRDALGDVYRHIRGGRYLEALNPSFIEEVRTEAQKKLKDELGAESDS